MLPIGPLMIEHRLIERMVRLMGREVARIRENMAYSRDFAFVDAKIIDTAVDFMRTYADEVHHGKEENILFAALEAKPLAAEQLEVMRQLQADHKLGRITVANLLTAKDEYLTGKMGALNQILENLRFLAEFYPRHIDMEDNHFFLPIMAYFSPEEKEDLLARMYTFDREFIHVKYKNLMAAWEAPGCKCHL